jgi:hypothetical protein
LRETCRSLRAAGALALLALVFPASAFAHTPQATVSCTGADFTWTAFAAGKNIVHWKVTVDNVTFREDTTQIGQTGSLHVPIGLNDGKAHVIEAFSWWASTETSDRNARDVNSPALDHKEPTCGSPPATTTTTTTTSPTPTPTLTPTAAPAPASVVQPAPQTVVAGTRAAAATARVAAQRTCATRAARVTISGRSIRQVTFFVNGRRVRR